MRKRKLRKIPAVTNEEILDKRQTRLEDVIEKLTNISNDLNRLLAVHEIRLNQHEKVIVEITNTLEKRREDNEVSLKNVYETIKVEDRAVLIELSKMEQKHSEHYDKITTKMNTLEKIIWTYMGGFSVVVFLITYLPTILKAFIG